MRDGIMFLTGWALFIIGIAYLAIWGEFNDQ